MTRDEAETLISRLVGYTRAADAAIYSSGSAVRARQASEAYELLVESLIQVCTASVQESSGQKPGSAAQAQAGEKPDSLAAEQSGETGPDDLAEAQHALHLFDAICSIHDSSVSATGRRTRAMAKVLEKLAVARDNRWPDPLESPQAEAIRSGKVDDTEIRNLFDTMERELRLHRERAALTPANPAQGVSDLIAKYRCAPDRPLSLPTAGKTIAMGWDDFLAIAAAIGAGQ